MVVSLEKGRGGTCRFSCHGSGCLACRVLRVLAVAGGTTGEAARKIQVPAARINQIRRELMLVWQAFIGDAPSPALA